MRLISCFFFDCKLLDKADLTVVVVEEEEEEEEGELMRRKAFLVPLSFCFWYSPVMMRSAANSTLCPHCRKHMDRSDSSRATVPATKLRNIPSLDKNEQDDDDDVSSAFFFFVLFLFIDTLVDLTFAVVVVVVVFVVVAAVVLVPTIRNADQFFPPKPSVVVGWVVVARLGELSLCSSSHSIVRPPPPSFVTVS